MHINWVLINNLAIFWKGKKVQIRIIDNEPNFVPEPKSDAIKYDI